MSKRSGFGGLLFEIIQSQTCMIFCIAAYRREQEEIALKRKLQFSVLASPNDLDRLTGIQNAL
jgi:hypothetical protein